MKTEPGADPSIPPRKFLPKAPPKKLKPKAPKSETVDTKEDVVDKELLSKFQSVQQSQDAFGRRMPRADKKSFKPQVAFGCGGESKYSRTSAGANDRNAQDGLNELAARPEKEYVDPYDYIHSYYPATLPLRMPYSGDPEVLNQLDFAEASTSSAFDELLSSAEKLNLMDKTDETQMLFFQLPASLPFPTPSDDNPEGKNIDTGGEVDVKDGASSSIKGSGMKNGLKLEEIPSGFMGKLLVYKNGAIKMKLGDALFDVSPGSECVFAQEVTAINTKEKHCCVLGEISKRAIVTPDLDALLESTDDEN